MSKTKKTPAKKSAAKKSTKPVFSKEQLVAILKRLEAGQTLVIEESKKLGYKHNPQLRKALTELLGSKQKYNAMLLRAVKARGGKKAPTKKPPAKKTQSVKTQSVKAAPVKTEPEIKVVA